MRSLKVLVPDRTVKVAAGLWLQSTLVSFPLRNRTLRRSRAGSVAVAFCSELDSSSSLSAEIGGWALGFVAGGAWGAALSWGNTPYFFKVGRSSRFLRAAWAISGFKLFLSHSSSPVASSHFFPARSIWARFRRYCWLRGLSWIATRIESVAAWTPPPASRPIASML